MRRGWCSRAPLHREVRLTLDRVASDGGESGPGLSLNPSPAFRYRFGPATHRRPSRTRAHVLGKLHLRDRTSGRSPGLAGMGSRVPRTTGVDGGERRLRLQSVAWRRAGTSRRALLAACSYGSIGRRRGLPHVHHAPARRAPLAAFCPRRPCPGPPATSEWLRTKSARRGRGRWSPSARPRGAVRPPVAGVPWSAVEGPLPPPSRARPVSPVPAPRVASSRPRHHSLLSPRRITPQPRSGAPPRADRSVDALCPPRAATPKVSRAIGLRRPAWSRRGCSAASRRKPRRRAPSSRADAELLKPTTRGGPRRARGRPPAARATTARTPPPAAAGAGRARPAPPSPLAAAACAASAGRPLSPPAVPAGVRVLEVEPAPRAASTPTPRGGCGGQRRRGGWRARRGQAAAPRFRTRPPRFRAP